jgi:hypothetical protein
MRTHAVAVVALVAAALLRPGTTQATSAADVCDAMADPCELTKEITVTPNSTLDFGARAFAIRAPDGRLQIGTGDKLSITAGSMVVETGPGGRLRSAPGSDGGCKIDVRLSSTFAVTRVAGVSSIAIDLSSPADPCELDVTADGDITIGAEIHARGIGVDSSGGGLYLSTAKGMTLADRILADSPILGGAVEIDARGPIQVTDQGSADVSDALGVGTIVLTTDSDIVMGGKLDVRGTSSVFACDAGYLILSAGGDITLNGPLIGNGAALPDGGCFGGTLSMDAGHNIVVNAPIDFSGGPNGSGGVLEDLIAGSDFIQTAPILLGAGGIGGFGGDAGIIAGRRVQLGAVFDLNGGPQGGGGNLTVVGAESVEIADEIGADGANFGSLRFLTTDESSDEPAATVPGRIRVLGDIHALSTAPEFAAEIRFEACEIEVKESGIVQTTGVDSRILLRASGAMKIAGTLDAGSGTNELQHRDPTLPPLILPAAKIVPAADVTATPDEPLRPCACTLDPQVAGILCDDHNPCTQEGCDPALGCTSIALSGEGIAGCDDGNVCDGRETCGAQVCRAGTAPVADDADPCTDDGACDPVAGYPHTPKSGFGAATCRMDRIETALAAAKIPGDVSAKAGKKIGNLVHTIRSLVEKAAGAGRGRRIRLLRAAAKRIRQLEHVVASPKSGVTSALAQLLTAATSETRTAIAQL